MISQRCFFRYFFIFSMSFLWARYLSSALIPSKTPAITATMPKYGNNGLVSLKPSNATPNRIKVVKVLMFASMVRSNASSVRLCWKISSNRVVAVYNKQRIQGRYSSSWFHRKEEWMFGAWIRQSHIWKNISWRLRFSKRGTWARIIALGITRSSTWAPSLQQARMMNIGNNPDIWVTWAETFFGKRIILTTENICQENTK